MKILSVMWTIKLLMFRLWPYQTRPLAKYDHVFGKAGVSLCLTSLPVMVTTERVMTGLFYYQHYNQ